MSLTPQEIAGKEFLVGLRGYDKEEVRTFLAEVARAFESAGSKASDPSPVDAPSDPAPAGAEAEAAATDSAEAAAGPAGVDWSNIGEEVATVLRTAHEQAASLRSDAERQAAETRSRAEAEAEATRASAEQQQAEAGEKLSAAQTEALDLVAEAQQRVDRMTEAARAKAQEDAAAEIAHLTSQIEELTAARAAAVTALEGVAGDVDAALRSARD